MDITPTAGEHVAWLLQCEKGQENMERMTEKVEDSDPKNGTSIFFIKQLECNRRK